MTAEQLLGPTLLALANCPQPPENLRALILAKTRMWVPDGENIMEWLNTHQPPVPVPPPAPPQTPRIAFTTERSGTENGTCSYTQNFTASGVARIREDRLRAILSQSKNRASALEELETLVHEETSEDYDYSDAEHDNYNRIEESTDECSTNAREVLETYLETHPELDPDREEEENEPDIDRHDPAEAADDEDRPF